MSKYQPKMSVVPTFRNSVEIRTKKDLQQSDASIMPLIVDDDLLNNEAIGLREPETSFHRLLWINVKLLTTFRLFSINFNLCGKLENKTTRILTPILLQVSQTMFVSICQIRSIFLLWDVNLDYAVTIFTGMLPGMLCTFKGFRLWFCQVKLRELLIYLAVLWEKSRFQTAVRKKTIKIADRTNLIRSWHVGMLVFLLGSYGIRPYVLLLQFQLTHKNNETFDYSETVYPTMYPFEINSLEKYLVCVTWEQFVATLLILYWASCDTLFAQLVTHTAIQFQVLHYDLKTIGAHSERTTADDETVLFRKLCSIVKRHRELFVCCYTIDAIYKPIIFFTMITSAINICFSVLNMQKELEHGNNAEISKNLCQLFTVFMQTLIYCGYANNLTYQSFRIAEAAYECDWIERNPKFKIVLQIIMMRAQKLHYLSGYGFFPLSLNQITTIVNSAMSFFTLLKTMT